MYFSSSSAGGSPSFYIELYKLSSGTLTLIASNSATPEGITNGTTIDLYTTSLAVPSTTLLAADRLAIRVYVTHSSKTITLHTEDSHLCQVITTFSTGINALNGLTEQVQSFSNDTNVTMVSSSSTHTITWAGTLADARIASATKWNTKTYTISIDGQGVVISTGSAGFGTAPLSGTITGWKILNGENLATGSIVIDIKRSGVSIIGAGNKPTLSTAIQNTANVSGWTSTTLTANDILEVNIDSATIITKCQLILIYTV